MGMRDSIKAKRPFKSMEELRRITREERALRYVHIEGDDKDPSLERRRDIQLALAHKIRAALKARGFAEQDILDDFEASKNS